MEESNNLDPETLLKLASDDDKCRAVLPEFKKPILVGKIGRLPKKIQMNGSSATHTQICLDVTPEKLEVELPVLDDVKGEECVITSDQQDEPSSKVPYKEPSWSSLPVSIGKPYVLEVLKSGAIVEAINLMNKTFWMFGRAGGCDIPLAHPTISRYHAVLQYRGEATEKDPMGFYIYDLASTHGSFLNKGRLKSRVYAPLRVGHLIKFGFSSRSFLLTGPEADTEEESEFTMTQLKQKQAEKLLAKELAAKETLMKQQQELEEKRKKEEERGVDWGLGEDAEEEPDLAENPYAQTNNEELYLDDPKKALRGFMEREGFNLDYDCSEHGFGQFLCKVQLPLDDEHGRPIIAEVLHKGKKKEAVVQCALEACRILDRHGILRQATHESRKRKAKNWEENDFYDSDDDTFLDRTGTVEKKREKRMHTKLPQQTETYQSLVEKEKNLSQEIFKIEKQLSVAKYNQTENQSSNANDEDALDSYMKELKESKLNKQSISKLKSELVRLRANRATVISLANLAKPTDLPPLEPSKPTDVTRPTIKKSLPLFGKRLKTRLQLPVKPVETKVLNNPSSEEEEVENENEINDKQIKTTKQEYTNPSVDEIKTQQPQEGETKGTKATKQCEIKQSQHDQKSNTEVTPHQTIHSDDDNDDSEDEYLDGREPTPEELKKRQKRNQRRIKQRRGKAEIQKQKGYEEDAQKEDYNMWTPPVNQTGDGRTRLNEKFGY